MTTLEKEKSDLTKPSFALVSEHQKAFNVYTENNPVAYVQTSKLGTSQICWLSELALFDFNIVHRLGRTIKATDSLSQHRVKLNCKLESESDTSSKDPVMLLYATICDIIKASSRRHQNPICCEKKNRELVIH